MASYRSIFASWPVRKKLLAVSMVLFLSAGAVIVSLGLEKRSELIGEAEMPIVDGLAVQQREITMGTEYLLSALAGDSAVQRLDAAACNDLFRRMNKLYPFFTVIEATTSDGVVLASSRTSRKGVELSGRGDIMGAIRERRFSAGDLRVEKADGGRSIDFSYPVLDENGRLAAVLTAGFEIGGWEYAGFLARMHLPPGYSVNYADRRGIRIWRLPPCKAAPPYKSLGGRRIVELIRERSDRGFFEQTGADGVFRIYAFAQLRLEEKAPPYMYIIVGAPRSAVTGQANRAMAMELLAVGATGVLALALTLLFGNISIAKPIEELVVAAQRLGRGEGSVRTGLAHAPDEVGRLAQAFDVMAELLEKRNAERQSAQEALADAYAESETLVRKRTVELSQSNAALKAEIAEHKLAEEERKRLLTAIEQSADEIIITDTNYIIDYVNPAFTVVTGYDGAEAIGRHMRFLKSGMYSRAFYRGIRETVNRGQVWSGRITNRKKDGSFYETEVCVSPVRNQSGAVIGFVCSYRDITLRLKLEKELRQAHKMEALGTLAGGIAHDFNNILAAMLGHAEIALCKLPHDTPVRSNLENVLKAGARAADLVKRILSFSRQAEHLRLHVSVAPLVRETLKLMAPTLPANIEVRSNTPSNPAEMVVLADPTEIHQVLINLCTNAAHAMSKNGGVLLVGLSRVVVSPSGEIEGLQTEDGRPKTENGNPVLCSLSSVIRQSGHALEPGPYICLAVSDTGVGIDPSVMEKIFDPYFTTKPTGEGTGLGLSVVRGIVSSYRGVITVRSEPGRGTTFRVFLRAVDKRTAAQTPENCPDDAGRSPGLTRWTAKELRTGAGPCPS